MQKINKITAVIVLVLGIVAIILGATLMGGGAHHSSEVRNLSHSAKYYNADGAAFGADFYTYMYDASDMIVDELNDINEGLSTVVTAQNAIMENTASAVDAVDDLIDAVGKAGGMIVIAIGLGILAYGIPNAGRAFAPVEKAAVVEDESVEEEVSAEE